MTVLAGTVFLGLAIILDRIAYIQIRVLHDPAHFLQVFRNHVTIAAAVITHAAESVLLNLFGTIILLRSLISKVFLHIFICCDFLTIVIY
jgi:hypothetical protein